MNFPPDTRVWLSVDGAPSVSAVVESAADEYVALTLPTWIELPDPRGQALAKGRILVARHPDGVWRETMTAAPVDITLDESEAP